MAADDGLVHYVDPDTGNWVPILSPPHTHLTPPAHDHLALNDLWYLRLDGANTMSGNLGMANHRLYNLAPPTADDHAMNRGSGLLKAGDQMTGSLGMGTNRIYGLGAPTADDHAVNRAHLESTSTAPFTFLDGWYSYGASFGTVQLRKAADGMVTVEGIFRHAGKAMTAGTTYQLATVPDGFRPPFQVLAPGNVQYQGCRVDVAPSTGVVTYAPSTAVTATYLSFAGCSWRAA